MEPTITLHKLRVFRKVVDRQSLTLAAQELFVSQPVVSAHVRDLENFFGSRLLYQHGRRMLLTEAGAAVYQYVLDVLHSTTDTRSIVRLLDCAEAGSAAIGASETPGAYRLPQRLTQFKMLLPRSEISLDIGAAGEICEATKHGHYDFAVVAGPEPAGDLHVELFSQEPMALVCAPNYIIAGQRVVNKGVLAHHPFVSLARRSNSSDDRLQELGVENPNIVMRLGNVEGLKEAVRGGLGLAVMFRCSVANELASGVLTELQVDGVSEVRPFYLVYNQRKRFSPMQSRLLDFLRAPSNETGADGLGRAVPSGTGA